MAKLQGKAVRKKKMKKTPMSPKVKPTGRVINDSITVKEDSPLVPIELIDTKELLKNVGTPMDKETAENLKKYVRKTGDYKARKRKPGRKFDFRSEAYYHELEETVRQVSDKEEEIEDMVESKFKNFFYKRKGKHHRDKWKKIVNTTQLKETLDITIRDVLAQAKLDKEERKEYLDSLNTTDREIMLEIERFQDESIDRIVNRINELKEKIK